MPSNRLFNLLTFSSEHQCNLRNDRLPSIKAERLKLNGLEIVLSHMQLERIFVVLN
jgi:hypothetical protein